MNYKKDKAWVWLIFIIVYKRSLFVAVCDVADDWFASWSEDDAALWRLFVTCAFPNCADWSHRMVEHYIAVFRQVFWRTAKHYIVVFRRFSSLLTLCKVVQSLAPISVPKFSHILSRSPESLQLDFPRKREDLQILNLFSFRDTRKIALQPKLDTIKS